jgi:hypothetical protein
MRELIRFAWGISTLGEFIVAVSDKGLVGLEFSSHRSATVDALRLRFPNADVIDTQEGLTDVLERLTRAIEELAALGIECEAGYRPCHLDAPPGVRPLPVTEGIWRRVLCIPVDGRFRQTVELAALARRWAAAAR